MLPGLHKVRARLAGDRLAEYWYAWRGGPRILKVEARTAADRVRLVEAAAADAAIAYRQLVTPQADRCFLSGLAQRYLESAEYGRLAPRTRRDQRLALDVVRADLGDMEIKALESPRARAVLIRWRDRYKATPRTADARMAALATILKWALDRGEITANPLTSWPRLYRVNRADIIWTPADLERLFTHCDPAVRRAVELAAHTGLRLADLVRLSWADVGKDAVTLTTGKSRGRRVITIPVTPEIRRILKACGRRPGQIGAVLVHSRGKPWAGGSGLQTAMQRAKTDAGIKGLRFHDLRGTAVTNLVLAGLPLADIALIVGWDLKKVEAIARHYVTGEAVARGMLARLRKNKGGAGL